MNAATTAADLADVRHRRSAQARYDAAGVKVANARVTVVWNGRVHDDVAVDGPTGAGDPESASARAIRLQDHGDKVRFRDVWVEPLS